MKGVDWGSLYNQFKGGLYDTAKLEDEIKALMLDDDVTRKKGIYSLRPQAATRNIWPSDSSAKPSGGRHTNDRLEYVLGVSSTSRWVRWKPTTSRHGRRVGRRTQPTVRCCVSRTTVAKGRDLGASPAEARREALRRNSCRVL